MYMSWFPPLVTVARISKIFGCLQRIFCFNSSNKTSHKPWHETDKTRSCVPADVVVVDILVKPLVFHEENPIEQFGGEIIEGSTEADDV